MKKNEPKKRFLSFRLTAEDLDKVYKLCNSTTCQSLTEYATKVLTRKPVIVKVRNQSADEILCQLIEIKNCMQTLIDRCPASDMPGLLAGLESIKSTLNKYYSVWSQS